MIENNINIQTHRPIHNNKTNNNNNTNGINGVGTIQNTPVKVIDPTRVGDVGKSDADNLQGQQTTNFNKESVHSQFIQALKNSPILSETVRKLVMNKQILGHIQSNKELSEIFKEFLDSISMSSEDELTEMIQNQAESTTKFKGELFNELRGLLGQAKDNKEFQGVLRNFLSAYDGYISSEETFTSVSNTLDHIGNSLPEILQEHFSELEGKLVGADTETKLIIIKNEILPFIGRYIAKMNDFGTVKDYTSLLLHNIVRMETGTEANLYKEMDSLLDYIRFEFSYTDTDIANLEQLFKNAISSKQQTSKRMGPFFDLIDKGLDKENDLATTSIMNNVLESMLFSQNVNINLMHIFLPINFAGKFMFSEIWVDFEKEKNKTTNVVETKYKIFINFDIQNMGYFETVVEMKNSKTSLDIYVPTAMNSHIDKIAKGFGKMLQDKGYHDVSVNISEMTKKRKFEEIFNNVMERRTGIDVVI